MDPPEDKILKSTLAQIIRDTKPHVDGEDIVPKLPDTARPTAGPSKELDYDLYRDEGLPQSGLESTECPKRASSGFASHFIA